MIGIIRASTVGVSGVGAYTSRADKAIDDVYADRCRNYCIETYRENTKAIIRICFALMWPGKVYLSPRFFTHTLLTTSRVDIDGASVRQPLSSVPRVAASKDRVITAEPAIRRLPRCF